MNNLTQKSAIDDSPIKIILGGKEFNFIEPKKRKASFLLGEALELLESSGIQMIEGEITEENVLSKLSIASSSLKAVPKLLDFIYDALDLSKETREILDDEFEIEELTTALMQIVEKLQLPFVGSKTISPQQ